MNDKTQAPALHAPEESKWAKCALKGKQDNHPTNSGSCCFNGLFMALQSQSCLLCPTVSHHYTEKLSE